LFTPVHAFYLCIYKYLHKLCHGSLSSNLLFFCQAGMLTSLSFAVVSGFTGIFVMTSCQFCQPQMSLYGYYRNFLCFAMLLRYATYARKRYTTSGKRHESCLAGQDARFREFRTQETIESCIKEGEQELTHPGPTSHIPYLSMCTAMAGHIFSGHSYCR
jgi:hypothetical protein